MLGSASEWELFPEMNLLARGVPSMEGHIYIAVDNEVLLGGQAYTDTPTCAFLIHDNTDHDVLYSCMSACYRAQTSQVWTVHDLRSTMENMAMSCISQ